MFCVGFGERREENWKSGISKLRVKRVLGRDWSGLSSAPKLKYNNYNECP